MNKADLIVDIANSRLSSQQITTTKFTSPKEIVSWMGVIQSQDYAMSKWAIGCRLPNSTEQIISKAIDKGEIIRTHILRPTWHLVAAEDIYWLLELTAPQIKSILKSSHKQLEITPAILTKTNKLITAALANNNHLTREELISVLEKRNIATDGNRASHIILYAELEGLICSGSSKEDKQTYALLSDRVLKPPPITREAALEKLANKYFTSHGPATLQDFINWSGLSITDARKSIEMIQSTFVSEKIGQEIYWIPTYFSPPKKDKVVYLLPAFDEYIIGYKNRSGMLSSANYKKVISNNGLFYPTIVINGQVTGSWKRVIKKDTVLIATSLFQPHTNSQKKTIEEEANKFGQFLDKKVIIKHA